MGHPLFERVGRKLVLTEAGRIALDYADTVFKAGDELMSTLRGRPVASRQVLRVGALTTLSRNFQLEFLRPLVGPLRCRVDRSLRATSATCSRSWKPTPSTSSWPTAPPRATRARRCAIICSTSSPSAWSAIRGRTSGSSGFRTISAPSRVLLPSLDSDIRVAFDRVLELAGIRPIILAEVDDMAMLRLLAREREGVTLVPPIVVRDELETGVLVEHCRIPEVTETFYAIIQKRRFPNRLLAELLPIARPSDGRRTAAAITARRAPTLLRLVIASRQMRSARPGSAEARGWRGHGRGTVEGVGRHGARSPATVSAKRLPARSRPLSTGPISRPTRLGLARRVRLALLPQFAPMSEIGPDGHPKRGGFLPPVDLPRRMWAGSRCRFLAPIRVGDEAEKTSTI